MKRYKRRFKRRRFRAGSMRRYSQMGIRTKIMKRIGAMRKSDSGFRRW